MFKNSVFLEMACVLSHIDHGLRLNMKMNVINTIFFEIDGVILILNLPIN